MDGTTKIRRAVISVSNKQGIEELGHKLEELGVEIISTGGTGRALKEAGVQYRPIPDITGMPEMLDGRVKTLHPKVHGGILYRRDLAEHVTCVEEHGLCPIDLLVVNLYPFKETIQKPGCTLENAIEQIDIGGPAMVRSAAKNHSHVAVVVDPGDYEELLKQIETMGGTTLELRRRLALKAFQHTSGYDAAIADYLASQTNPAVS